MTFATLLALRREFVVCAAVIAVGAISREVVLLALPLMFVVAPREWRRLAILAVIPIAVWLLVWINTTPSRPEIIGEDTLNIVERFWAIREIRAGGSLLSWAWFWRYFAVIGPLWLLGYQYLEDKRLLCLLSVCLLVFVAGDTMRMVLFAVPVLVPVVALGLSRMSSQRWRLVGVGAIIGSHAIDFWS